jgi:uncharacterized protein YbcI
MPSSQFEDLISAKTKALLGNLGLSTEDITISLDDRCLIIQLHKLLRSANETLVGLDDGDMRATRDLIADYVLPDLVEFSKKENGIAYESIYYDWNDNDFSGLIIAYPQGGHYRVNEDYYPGKDDIHRQIAKITYDVQKVPDRIYSFWAGDNILVIVREGILIKIEKELFKLGFKDSLWTAKRTLEKESFLAQGQVADILNRKQLGIYVDWDFALDKSVLIYVFENK